MKRDIPKKVHPQLPSPDTLIIDTISLANSKRALCNTVDKTLSKFKAHIQAPALPVTDGDVYTIMGLTCKYLELQGDVKVLQSW